MPIKTAQPIQIKSLKHNGAVHRIWESNIVLQHSKINIIGANDQTLVREGNGEIWYTKAPAIFYFHSAYWFNIIGMLKEKSVEYYCNISSPFVYDSGTILYIDYDLDVIVCRDMTYRIVDGNEYERHKQLMNYPEQLEQILCRNLTYLIQWIKQQKGPFSPDFIERWYEQYLAYKQDSMRRDY